MGQRFGVRVNSADAFELAKEVARAEGWRADESEEPVTILYSLRVAESSTRRGQRNYHLLYLVADRIARTLCTDVLRRDFRKSVWAVAALMEQDVNLLLGDVLELSSRLIFVPRSDEDRGAQSLIDAMVQIGAKHVAREYVQLERTGRLRVEGGARAIDMIVSVGSEEESSACLSPGNALLKILPSSITPIERSLRGLRELAQACPFVHLDWGPQSGASVVNDFLRGVFHEFS